MSNIINDLKGLHKDGKNSKELRGWLAFMHSLEGKHATKLLVEAGISSSASGGTFNSILDFLSEKPRTKEALYKHLLENSSVNECRWATQRDTIRATINSVFEKCGEKIPSKEPSESLTAEVKAKGSKKAGEVNET